MQPVLTFPVGASFGLAAMARAPWRKAVVARGWRGEGDRVDDRNRAEPAGRRLQAEEPDEAAPRVRASAHASAAQPENAGGAEPRTCARRAFCTPSSVPTRITSAPRSAKSHGGTTPASLRRICGLRTRPG